MKTLITTLALLLVGCAPGQEDDTEQALQAASSPAARLAPVPDAGELEGDAGEVLEDAGEVAPECLEHADCGGRNACVAGRCAVSCAQAEGCLEGFECRDVFDDVGAACTDDLECPEDVCEGATDEEHGRCSLSGAPCAMTWDCVPPTCDAETGRCRYRRVCVEAAP